MCNHSKPASGFTLLELIIAISIAGVLMAMAIPSFRDMIRSSRLTTYTNEFVTALSLARNEAIKRGAIVHVRKIGGTGTYWSTSGWMVFVDKNANDTFEAGTDELLKTYDALPKSFTLKTNSINATNYVSYKPDGTTNVLAGASFAICDISDSNNIPEPYTSRLIIINAVGRVRMGRDNGYGIPKDSTGATLSSCYLL
jgi:type IV fimbrial biogenesis protein FimT